MTIYSDAINNKFLGDCIWANHDINYPTTKFLQAHPYSSISAELTSLVTASGLKFRDVATQATFDTLSPYVLLTFGANSDTIDDRYTFLDRPLGSPGSTVFNNGVALFNNNGFIGTNAWNGTNNLTAVSNFSGQNNNAISTQRTVFAGCSDGESLGLFWYNTTTTRIIERYALQYAGTLADVNSNFNYYSENQITRSILATTNHEGGSIPVNSLKMAHFIAGGGKLCLTTGDAQYPIVCADGQNPTSQWATDMYVFDNDATLGYPAIGRVRNLLLAQGTYTIGKPVKIQGSAMPDAGFNRWLPVGTFAGKTVLMRCYSSVNI
jgi:hypothetical protein